MLYDLIVYEINITLRITELILYFLATVYARFLQTRFILSFYITFLFLAGKYTFILCFLKFSVSLEKQWHTLNFLFGDTNIVLFLLLTLLLECQESVSLREKDSI